jgi:lysophospholipase L1-like esterase
MFSIYLIAAHCLLGLVLWKSDFLTKARSMLTAKHSTDGLAAHYRSMRRYHARSAEIVPTGSVFFIGDSIIQGLAVEAVAAPAINYGIGGDTTVGVLERLDDYAWNRASALVLCIGGNDLRDRRVEVIADNIEGIVTHIDSRLPVILSAVLPVDESARVSLRGRNARITALNRLLKSLSDRHAHVIFASYSHLSEETNLKPDLHVGDGLHPNNKGNRIIAANLRSAISSVNLPSVTLLSPSDR